MTSIDPLTAKDALEKASKALHENRPQDAQLWAKKAAILEPNWEAPWLILAALGSPAESIQYLKKALAINPASQRARKGMHWAIQRYRTSIPIAAPTISEKPAVEQTQRIRLKPSKKPAVEAHIPQRVQRKAPGNFRKIMPFLATFFIIFILLIAAFGFFSPHWLVLAQNQSGVRPLGVIEKPSLTPTKTFTPTATSTATATATATSTSTPSPSPTSTYTLTATVTDTPEPTSTLPQALPTFTQAAYDPGPISPPNDGRWIDINLSTQQLVAYENDTLISAFPVSTGTWQHPTVTGQYKVYVKYLYTDMAGPGYYLPDVPYTMYFYQGYGIHGTYWHNNFGTPMSHGCVNMRTEDAGWLFSWASIGTVVNIHY